jgi:hypothetical protein
VDAPFPHDAVPADARPAAPPDRRRCLGLLQAPIVATHAYRLRPADDSCRRFEKWALINERAGTVTFVTTLDGRAGRDYDAARNTFARDFYSACPSLADFEPVPVERCPVAARDPLSSAAQDWPRLAA